MLEEVQAVRFIRAIALATATLVFACVPPAFEGDDPGECSDAADNDLDGSFDCLDPDCFTAPPCQDDGYPTEANLFDDFPQGTAQLDTVCERMAAADIQNVVRDVFCVGTRPQITNSRELLNALGLRFDGPGGMDAQQGFDMGNPAWSLVGHSASLSRRIVNPVNPRVIVHTPASTHRVPVPGFVTVAFVRGEGFAEIIAHDAVRDDLDFFLFKFTYPCADPDQCTEEERFSEQYESGWTDYTLYEGSDLENTILDCLQCHEHGLRTSPVKRKSLLMFQLNSMWMHWMYDNQHFYQWTENPLGMGPFHEMLQQYVQAHATPQEPLGETFGGIPNGAVYASRPKSLEDLVEGNGYGNGFDSTAYEPNGASTGLLEDGRARGMFKAYAWEELYELSLQGLMVSPPGPGEVPFDADKMQTLIDTYNAYRRGDKTAFPADISDVFDDSSLSALGLRVSDELTAPEILVQACSQCHHGELNQSISRAQFEVGPAAFGQPDSDLGDHFINLTSFQLDQMKERINLPSDHLGLMPPARFRTLTTSERAAVSEWLDTLIDGLEMADDGEPPTPLVPGFDIPPSEVGRRAGLESLMPNIQRSMATMRAVPGSDPAGYVEYYFEETTGRPGGTSSGWQLSPRYVDTDLIPGETYSYRVKMRDRAGNESVVSVESGFRINPDWLECDPIPVDSDCDKVPDSEEFDGDTDGDGVEDRLDIDDDGDGIATNTEVEDGDNFGHDIDGDGIMNWLDTNVDDDPFDDAVEGVIFPFGNSLPGYMDPNYPCGDGICNAQAGYLQESCSICPVDCCP